MLLAVATPMHMMAPINDGTFNVVCVTNSIHRMPASAPGRARQNDERIHPGLKIDRHQQVYQNDGREQAQAQPIEGALHGGGLSAQHDLRGLGNLGLLQ